MKRNFFRGAGWEASASVNRQKIFFSILQYAFFMAGLNYLFSPERKTSFMRRAFSLISEKLHSKKYFSGLKKEGAFQNAPLRKVVPKQPTLPTVQKIRTESGALKCRFPPLCARRTFLREVPAISNRPY